MNSSTKFRGQVAKCGFVWILAAYSLHVRANEEMSKQDNLNAFILIDDGYSQQDLLAKTRQRQPARSFDVSVSRSLGLGPDGHGDTKLADSGSGRITDELESLLKTGRLRDTKVADGFSKRGFELNANGGDKKQVEVMNLLFDELPKLDFVDSGSWKGSRDLATRRDARPNGKLVEEPRRVDGDFLIRHLENHEELKNSRPLNDENSAALKQDRPNLTSQGLLQQQENREQQLHQRKRQQLANNLLDTLTRKMIVAGRGDASAQVGVTGQFARTPVRPQPAPAASSRGARGNSATKNGKHVPCFFNAITCF